MGVTRYPSNRIADTRVETRGGSRSVRNTRQFIPGKQGGPARIPPKRSPADYSYIGPDEGDWDEVDRANRERARDNIRKNHPDLARRMKLTRDLAKPARRAARVLDALELAIWITNTDTSRADQEFGQFWDWLWGGTVNEPAQWLSDWFICKSAGLCTTAVVDRWANGSCTVLNVGCNGQAIGMNLLSVPVPAVRSQIYLGQFAIIFGQPRLRIKEVWQRVTAGDIPAPYSSPASVPTTRPYPAQLIAGARPEPWGMPDPKPAVFGDPYTQPPGDPDPAERSRPGDAPTRTVALPIMPFPVVAFPWPGTALEPTPQPDTQVIIIPPPAEQVAGDSPPPEPPTASTRPGRPRNSRNRGEGKFERKVRMSGGQALAWMMINVVTESIDFVESLHQALPYRQQAKPTKGHAVTPTEMAEAIWRHRETIDVAKAVENFVNMQIEDWFYGRIDQAANLNQLTGAPTGGGTAIDGQWRPDLYDLGEPVKLVPELHFDPVTGAWAIDTPFGSIQGNVGDRYW